MTPKIVGMEVYPVAGRDSMLLNHQYLRSYFTRNVLVLEDSGNIGINEVRGHKITRVWRIPGRGDMGQPSGPSRSY